METNVLFIGNTNTFDPASTKEMIRAWNLIGVDYKKCRFSLTVPEVAVAPEIKAVVTVGSEYSEKALGFPFSNLGRLETFAGQAFKHPHLAYTVFPIYSPYVCKSPKGANQFYGSVARFWESITNPIVFTDNFDSLEASQTNSHPYSLDSDLAIDTEGTLDNPWSVQVYPDEKQFYGKDERAPIDFHRNRVYHSGLHDANVMEKLGYDSRVDDDTLLMAYSLNLPLGLKELTVRELGVVLTPYVDMIGGVLKRRLIAYFEDIQNHPFLNVGEGRKHSPAKRVQTLLNNLDKEGAQGIWKKWNSKALVDVKEVAEKVLNIQLEYPTLDDIDFDKARVYACNDPKATFFVKKKLVPKLKAIGVYSAYRTNVDLIPMVVSMHKTGMPIDLDRVQTLSTEIYELEAKLDRELKDEFGEDFNPRSSLDKLEALKASGAELIKKTPGGNLSTGKKILKGLTDNELAQRLFKYSEISKLKTTYVPALTSFIGKDGWIHPTWRMTPEVDNDLELGEGGAGTGRLTCSKPNVMAFPERTGDGLGKRFKKCFKAPDGWVFANADLDQIEMRIMAHMADCKPMIDAIWQGLDMHTNTASLMFKIPFAEVDKAKHRFPAKTINFLMIFEGGAQKLVEQLAAEGVHLELEEAKKLIADWYAIYPEIKEYQRIKHVEAEVNGFVSDFWGNIRYTEGARAVNRMSASGVMRQAGNFPIQSGAQVLFKRAMVRIWKTMQLPLWRDNVKIVAQIHDELVFLIREGYQYFMQEVVQKELVREQYLLKVPLSSSVGFGESWGDLK